MDLDLCLQNIKQLEKENKIDLAIEKCSESIQAFPNSCLIYQRMGDLIAKQIRQSQILPFANVEEALTQPYTFCDVVNYYRKAIEINPSLSEIKQKIDQYLVLSEKYSDVLKASQKQGVIVAGIPRCGTTLAFRAIAGLSQGNTTPKDYYGLIKKTHCLAPKNLPSGYKAVFIFGDIVRAVISTKRARYERNHFMNCGCFRNPEEVDIFQEDALNYGLMFDSWHQSHNYPVICIRYEKIHKNIKILSNFLNMDISLPKKAKRSTKYSDCSRTKLNQIKKTYQSLISKISSNPDVSIYI